MKPKNMLKLLNEGIISNLEGGDTKHTFLLRHQNNKYVLRIFKNKATASYYITICKKLLKYNFLPYIYCQHGKKVLFEYIEGRDCNKQDASSVAAQVGRICAWINKLKNTSPYDADKRFFSYITTLKIKKLVDIEKASDIKKLYLSLKKKVRPKITLDANDVYPENFRLRNGKVYLVDIEAIKPLFMGHGIAKSFIRWFKTPKQREKFKEGYRSVSSLQLTNDYLQFLYLNFFIRSIALKLRLHTPLNLPDVFRLNRLLEGTIK